jgi:hypothetical protein
MDDRVERLRVLWNKGRNMYAAFFSELDAVRHDVGDENLSDWCFNELHISLSIISDMASLLKKPDADHVRMELAKARLAQQRARSEQARLRREQIAERRAARAERDKERVKEKANEKRRQRYAERGERLQRPPLELGADDLAAGIKADYAALVKNNKEWTERSVAIATKFHALRKCYLSNNEFGAKVHDYGLDFYSHQDRAALIHFGENPEKAREVFGTTDSKSYQLIWRRFTNVSKTDEDEAESKIHRLFQP